MSLIERIDNDSKEALRSRDPQRLSVLRMLKAKLLEAEVAARAKRGRDAQLNDEDALQVVGRYAKQIKQSIDAFRQGGRNDLVDQEEAQLAVVEQYLPKQLSQDEVRAIVQSVIEELGATSPKEMGKVIREAMSRMQGVADGKQVSNLVRELLSQ